MKLKSTFLHALKMILKCSKSIDLKINKNPTFNTILSICTLTKVFYFFPLFSLYLKYKQSSLRAEIFAEQIFAESIFAILAINRKNKFRKTYKILKNRKILFRKI